MSNYTIVSQRLNAKYDKIWERSLILKKREAEKEKEKEKHTMHDIQGRKLTHKRIWETG